MGSFWSLGFASLPPGPSYLIRLVGTFLGLIVALLIWYIGGDNIPLFRMVLFIHDLGNGNGNGTPYGLAVSYAVFMLPVMFVRLFAPPKYLTGVILGTVRI